jgi:hypothetical protein
MLYTLTDGTQLNYGELIEHIWTNIVPADVMVEWEIVRNLQYFFLLPIKLISPNAEDWQVQLEKDPRWNKYLGLHLGTHDADYEQEWRDIRGTDYDEYDLARELMFDEYLQINNQPHADDPRYYEEALVNSQFAAEEDLAGSAYYQNNAENERDYDDEDDEPDYENHDDYDEDGYSLSTREILDIIEDSGEFDDDWDDEYFVY